MDNELAEYIGGLETIIDNLVEALAGLLGAGAHTEPDATACPRCVAENAARAAISAANAKS